MALTGAPLVLPRGGAFVFVNRLGDAAHDGDAVELPTGPSIDHRTLLRVVATFGALRRSRRRRVLTCKATMLWPSRYTGDLGHEQ